MGNDVLAAIKAQREEEENQREAELRTLLGSAEPDKTPARAAAELPAAPAPSAAQKDTRDAWFDVTDTRTPAQKLRMLTGLWPQSVWVLTANQKRQRKKLDKYTTRG